MEGIRFNFSRFFVDSILLYVLITIIFVIPFFIAAGILEYTHSLRCLGEVYFSFFVGGLLYTIFGLYIYNKEEFIEEKTKEVIINL